MTTLRQAAEEALEALETLPCGDSYKTHNAAVLLIKALAEPEQWKTCRHCGFDYKPPKMDKWFPLEQTEQEPLGSEWVPCVKLPVIVHVRNQKDGEAHISTREGITPVLPEDLIMRGVAGEEYPIGRELFERTYTFDTAPPQRQWVGLSTDEMMSLCQQAFTSDFELASAIEAKLKEKNT
jgi:hypothetical protein